MGEPRVEPGPWDSEGKKASNPNPRNTGWIPPGVGKRKGNTQRTGSRTRGKRPEARALEAAAPEEAPVFPGPALLSDRKVLYGTHKILPLLTGSSEYPRREGA